jgi:PAS domain S-box-containing protein
MSIWLRVSAIPVLKAGQVSQVYVTFEDITERKRSETELAKYRRSLEVLVAERTSQLEAANISLREQGAEVEDLFNHAPCGYHSLDVNGNFLRMNDTELSWLGYARTEVIGRSFREFLTEASRLTFESRFSRFKETGYVNDIEFDMVRKDGSLLPVSISATLVRDAAGNFLHSRSTVFDNTERKERARQIDILNADLARRAEEAEAANRAKGAFLANMSHEFRTPMNGIMGMTYLLQDDVSEPEQLDKLRIIGQSAKHLLGILNDILDISRLEAGNLNIEKTDFSLAELLDASLREIRGPAEAKGLRVVNDVEPRLADTLRGDAARLSQVLRNFLDNAVKFTKKGGVVLRARKLDESDTDILLRFEIQDSGIGLSPDDQARLFRAFEQVDASTTRAYGGTGLGLAINKRIIQLMGGSLGVDSQIDIGSTFWFTLRFDKAIRASRLPSEVSGDDEISNPNTNTEPDPDVEEKAHRVLKQLKALIGEDNIQARYLMRDSAALLRPLLGEHFVTIRDRLEEFDFVGASTLLEAWLKNNSASA